MAEREIIHVLKRSDTVNRPLPSVLKHGEPIINSADGIMYFSGVTSSTDEWTPAGTGATANFFEVGSNLYDLTLRNKIIGYQGVSGAGLAGKFLSGTTSGFALADISDISGTELTGANGITVTTGDTVELGGTLTQATNILGNGQSLNLGTGGSRLGNTFLFSSSLVGISVFDGVDGGGVTFLPTMTSLAGPIGSLGLVMTSGSTVFTDDTTANAGIEYAADYTTGFTNESLITKRYVDNQITGNTLTDGNGTTANGTAVDLGGTLNGDTKFLPSGNGTLVSAESIHFGDFPSAPLGYFDITTSGATGMRSYDLTPGSPTFGHGGDFSINSLEVDFGTSGFNGTGHIKVASGEVTLQVLTGGSDTSLVINSLGTEFTDESAANEGIKYAADYSATYIDRSLVDKEYVDNQITGNTLTGANGITTTTGGTVELGGTLDKNTDILGASNNLSLGTGGSSLGSLFVFADDINLFSNLGGDNSPYLGMNGDLNLLNFGIGGESLAFSSGSTLHTSANGTGIHYDADYSATYIDRSLVDKEYVDNQITGITGTLAVNSMVYTDASGILTTETGFTYDAGTDTMTVGNVAVQNGTGDTATFGQGGVTVGSGGVGDLTVQGDLTVLGDTTTVSTSELYIEDPTITLNYSTGTTNVTSLGSGIEVQDGDGAGTDLYLKIEELNTAYAVEYPATTGAGNRAFYTSLNDIVIRQATDTTSPSVGQVGKRVLAEDDVLDGGTY